MKMFVAGLKNLSGVSKKTGNDFVMCRLYGLVQVENFKKENLSAVGFGFEVAEIEFLPECLPVFAGIKFPVVLDLETDSMPFMGEFKTVVTGIRAAAVKAA